MKARGGSALERRGTIPVQGKHGRENPKKQIGWGGLGRRETHRLGADQEIKNKPVVPYERGED